MLLIVFRSRCRSIQFNLVRIMERCNVNYVNGNVNVNVDLQATNSSVIYKVSQP